MKFYHGTTEENWERIVDEGVLYGRRYIVDGETRNPITELERCTYLAVDPEEANNYGDVLLEVEYNPYKKDARCNHFEEGCWQLRVYEPIEIKNIKRVKIQDLKSIYIRFGDIPESGFSTIYSHGEESGKEKGISCYRALIDENDVVHICLPLPFDSSKWNVFQGFILYDDRPAYLITGDLVGYGSEGEPLLENVKIAKYLKKYREKDK